MLIKNYVYLSNIKAHKRKFIRMKNIILIVLTIIILTACKKEYTCECDNPGGHVVYVIHDSKKNAEKECFAASDFPWSETMCTLK